MKRRSTLVGLAVMAAVLYVVMWVGWTSDWRWLASVDGTALDAAHRVGAQDRGWVISWDVLCSMFSPVTFRVLVIGLIVYEFIRRRPAVGFFLIVSIELSGVITEVAKRLADRPRPATAMVDATSTSFPSGHALGTMVAVLALAVVLLPRIPQSSRPWAIGAGVLIVVLVGVGRVALNVHHPSDVVAGWALGYLYFLACLPLLQRQPVTAADETPAALDTAR